MPRPTPRKPAAAAGPLAPAPDSGQPFTTQRTPKTGENRTAVQLGVRIPPDLMEDLRAESEATDVPLTKIVIRALRERQRRN